MNKKDIRPGDILLESAGEIDNEFYRDVVARYLVVGRHIEWDKWHGDPRPIMYFETILLRVGATGSSWYNYNSPGDSYHLSEHEITSGSSWERLYQSPLLWSDEYDFDNRT